MAGFWDSLLRPAWRFFEPRVSLLGSVDEVLGTLYSEEHFSTLGMWERQPHLRTVLTFLARNVAHVGLHLYERVDDTDRRRDLTSAGARVLIRPNPRMTMYELLFALTVDRKLYDRAYWWLRNTDDGPQIYRLPPAWVNPIRADLFSVKKYQIINEKGNQVDIPAEQVLPFTGYNPTNPLIGSPTIQALRDVLLEQMEAALYRKQVWKRGGRVSAVLTRPLGAKWSDGARSSFREDWYAKWTGRGDKAGGTPILEDGMDIKRIDFSAHEQQFVEASKLAMATVASAFHVQPSMVGVLDNANFSVVKEFRQMLYTETLGPDFEDIAQRLNGFLLPMLGLDPARYYYEFNIQRKLQGSFEEQAAVISTSVGAPWMTRNEARGRMNLPSVPDGDTLVTPLNVLIGGQASPRDTGDQNRNAASAARKDADLGEKVLGVIADGPVFPPLGVVVDTLGTKDAETDPDEGEPEEDPRPEFKGYADKYTEILTRTFDRQRSVVAPRLKAGDADWWDAERWDRELGHDLLAWAMMVGPEVARATLVKYGIDPDTFDPALAEAWYAATSTNAAKAINASTKSRVDEALALSDPAEAKARVAKVFGVVRAAALAVSAVTIIAGFSRHEAGQQSGATTKTWVTGRNPRPSHASMSGETVLLSENFSNGLAWPGDGGDVAQVAGCNCELELGWG